jgi:hypothetical protein
MKKRYLVAYDYGMGGAWASVLADSAEEITSKYPSVKIVTRAPKWLDAARLRELEERMTVDIDDDDHVFFRAVRAEESSEQ